MCFFTDQLNRTIELSSMPGRIVSLVPSQTELLFDLGLDAEVIGITKFCVHPQDWFRKKERIGGTKNINLAKVRQLQPDLIIANKEENVKEQIDALASEFPVWISDINDLETAYEMMLAIGQITGSIDKAEKLVNTIKTGFAKLPAISKKLNAAYLIWKDPYMTVGSDTFIHHTLSAAGFDNVFRNRKRYPVIEISALQESNCELLFLSSEPYPFKQKHIDELQASLPQTKILLVDGEMFSWYGSRLAKAPMYFQTLHQQLAGKP
ncbi:MAG: cobalamin-binding protein [Chitinophagaceae bacterium]|nr:MAG: cobalamin-binding protein [Chitinophagaceae bacterium]